MKNVYIYMFDRSKEEQPKITGTIEIAQGVMADFSETRLVGIEILNAVEVTEDYTPPVRPE